MEKILSNTYELGALLGSGGMGSVYEGRHIRTNQRVAVKVISRMDRRDAQALHRFEREAKAVARLKTPHIVSVLDTGSDEELGPFTVMEYLKGRDLDELVDELGPLPPTLVLKISAQIALGLKAAHAENIVHRDIKPANVFLEDAGGDLIVCRILDFGIAKVLGHGEFADTGLTNSGSMMGSPRYMSPEQARRAKHADHRADIWSLGVTIYKALSGVTPTDHLESMADLIISLCQEPARPLQSVAPWVEGDVAKLVHACLAIEPAGRLQTVDEWLSRVRELLPGGFDIHARELVPLSKEARERVATRVAVPGFSTSGAALGRTSGDALAATASVGAADVPTRIEGSRTPGSSSSSSVSRSAERSAAPMTPRLEESISSQPTSRAVAPTPPRRVWTYAVAGAALSIATGLAVVRITQGSPKAVGTAQVAASTAPPTASDTLATTATATVAITPADSAPSVGAPSASASGSPAVPPSKPTTSAATPQPPVSTPTTPPTPPKTAPTVVASPPPKTSTGSGELKGTFE